MSMDLSRAVEWWNKGRGEYHSSIILAKPGDYLTDYVPWIREREALEVIGLYVHPARRGLGWGAALMGKACTYADALGVPLVLFASPYGPKQGRKGPAALCAFYAGFGFERVRRPRSAEYDLPVVMVRKG